MQNCKPVYEPVVTSQNATDDKSPTDCSLFQQLVGALLYLAVTTRPDIAFVVNLPSQACKSPTVQDFIATKRVLRYLNGTNYFLSYSLFDNGLGNFSYSDANWASDVKIRKSVSGMVIKLNESDSPGFWRTAKPRLVSLSTCELENMALSALAQEVLFLKHVFESVNYKTTLPILFSNNQGAICVAHQTASRSRAKHRHLSTLCSRTNDSLR